MNTRLISFNIWYITENERLDKWYKKGNGVWVPSGLTIPYDLLRVKGLKIEKYWNYGYNKVQPIE